MVRNITCEIFPSEKKKPVYSLVKKKPIDKMSFFFHLRGSKKKFVFYFERVNKFVRTKNGVKTYFIKLPKKKYIAPPRVYFNERREALITFNL